MSDQPKPIGCADCTCCTVERALAVCPACNVGTLDTLCNPDRCGSAHRDSDCGADGNCCANCEPSA